MENTDSNGYKTLKVLFPAALGQGWYKLAEEKGVCYEE